MRNTIIQGNALSVLETLPEALVDCCITSPPYWGLRDYQIDGQLGLEPRFEDYISKLCDIFDEVKRVLKPTGTCWVVMGDTYGGANSGQTQNNKAGGRRTAPKFQSHKSRKSRPIAHTLPKCLLGIPSLFYLEMVHRRGWIGRNEIIWHKPNAMPLPVKDRFTVDFEEVFFFCKAKEKSNDIKEWLRHPLKREDASWLAAMIDAEGTIGIRRSKTDRPRDSLTPYITVNMTNQDVINRCKSLTSYGAIRQDTAKTNFDLWRWEVQGNAAVTIIGEIFPFLIVKREQAKVAIAVQKENKYHGNQYKSSMPEAVYQKKLSLWAMCKQLNQREIMASGLPEPNLNRISGCENYFFEQQFETYAPASEIRYKQALRMNRSYGGGGAVAAKNKADLTKPPRYKRGIGSVRSRGDDADGLVVGGFNPNGRNKRCVWTIPTQPSNEPHFAMFPEDLIAPMIRAGCPEAGIVLDPFIGMGTTAIVARKLNRDFIGIELNPDYCQQAEIRLERELGFLAMQEI